MTVLKYARYENFEKIIQKVIIPYENSDALVKDCFHEVAKSIKFQLKETEIK